MSEFKKNYIPVHELEVYKLARELSGIAWEIYNNLKWLDQKTMGNQFLEATDLNGANIVEGYARYHHLDRIKFFYNARASLREANDHWIELLFERDKVDEGTYKKYKNTAKKCSIKLQKFINSTYRAKNNNK